MAENNEPAVRVTLSTIYQKLLDIDKKVDPLTVQVTDHETRIRILEKQVWQWLGAAGVGGGLSSLVTWFLARG